MQKLFTIVAATLMLAGCGTAPTLAPQAATTGAKVAAQGLFSSFKESDYQAIDMKKLDAIDCDSADGKTCQLDGPQRNANKGKKFKFTGAITYSKGSMSIAPYVIHVGDVTVYSKNFLFESSAESFLNKVGAKHWTDGKAEVVTAYVTLKSPAATIPYTFDAVKRADGTLVRL
jgi:hypothetical protein